jgi:hypothetical protein
MVDEALRKHPQPVTDKEPAKGKAIATTKPSKPRRRLLDERCAQVFPNDHQFKAFREAVTTSTAQKAIPVEQQYALAQEIMRVKHDEFSKKQTGAPYIKMMVQTRVQDFMKAQRPIDKEERERYLFEQREARIDAELKSANASVRALISAIAKMIDLADEFPCHPKLGGFSARLDQMKGAIEQLSKALK